MLILLKDERKSNSGLNDIEHQSGILFCNVNLPQKLALRKRKFLKSVYSIERNGFLGNLGMDCFLFHQNIEDP